MRNFPHASRFVVDNPSARALDIPTLRLREGREGGGEDRVNVYAQPITDTCKEVVNGMVCGTVPRGDLVDAQGPWVFSRDALSTALDASVDDAKIDSIIELCRRAGLPIRVQSL